MATSNAERFLSDGATDDALALEMFFGLVQEAFYNNTLLWNAIESDGGVGAEAAPTEIVASKRVTSGKSWQFVNVADAPDPTYHTPGTELLGQQFEFDEGNITIDGILVGHRDVPIDQILKAHWDVLTPVARGIGRSLARDFDRKLFITGALAALASSSTKGGLTVHNGGNVVERVDGSGMTSAYPVSKSGAKAFRDDAEHLAQLLDDDNVPEQGRYLFYNNYIHRVLQQDTTIFDERFTRDTPNSLNRRIVGEMAGFLVMPRSNHLPDENITSSSWGGGVPSKYQHDFTYDGSDDGQPVALALCGADEGRAPIGYVAAASEDLSPIYAIREKDERRNTEFMKAQMMVGADTLYPPTAGAIIVDDA